jgi:hypothetical protein
VFSVERRERENGGTKEKEIQIAEGPASFPRSFENAAGCRVSPVPGTCVAPSCLSGMRNIQGQKHYKGKRELK